MEEFLRNFDLVPVDVPMIIAGALLFVALWRLLENGFFGPLKKLYEARESATVGAEQKAKDTLAQTESLLADYNRSMSSARAEAAKKRFEAVALAKQEAAQIVSKAEAGAQEKMRAARSEFTAQANQIRSRLDSEANPLSEEIVRRILPESLGVRINSVSIATLLAIWFGTILMALPLVLPDSSFAAGAHGAHGTPPFSDYLNGLWAYWANFLLFVIVLSVLLRKPLARAWLGRIESIQDSVENAKRTLGEAAKQLSLAEAKLAGLPGDIQKVLNESQKETEIECARVISEAKERAERIKSSCELSIKAERRLVERTLQSELAELAFEKATSKLKGAISPEVDQALRDQCLTKVGELSSANEVIQ